MSSRKEDRTALFIDGANLYYAAKAVNLEIDYKKMHDYFSRNSKLVRAYYYTAMLDEQEFSSIRPLIDWLDYNGYTVVTKKAKEFTDSAGRKRIKGNMDIEISIDMLELSEHLDHIILFSGDGDFRRLVEAVQRKGCRVTVISTVQSRPPMAADELRRQADEFVELCDLEGDIARAIGGHVPDDDNFHAGDEAAGHRQN